MTVNKDEINEPRKVLGELQETIRQQAEEIERLRNGLIAIKTRTYGCGEGTTAGEVYKIAARTLLELDHKGVTE